MGWGNAVGSALASGVNSALDDAAKEVWDAGIDIFHSAMASADQLSVFTVSTTSGPIADIWPLMLWLSGILAVGLYFLQLITSMLRGGRGMLRSLIGPAQYGIALAVTVGVVAVLLTAVDGITQGILTIGLRAGDFGQGAQQTDVAVPSGVAVTRDQIKAVVLLIAAIFGLIPVSLGIFIEMLCRQAAILVLVACVPITAAGLLHQITTKWWWITVRSLLACIFVKPIIALVMAISVAAFRGPGGLNGLLIGLALLLISVLSPLALFKMLAFVESADPAAAVRDWAADRGIGSGGGGGMPGEEAAESAHKSRNDEDSEDKGDDGGGKHKSGQGDSGQDSDEDRRPADTREDPEHPDHPHHPDNPSNQPSSDEDGGGPGRDDPDDGGGGSPPRNPQPETGPTGGGGGGAAGAEAAGAEAAEGAAAAGAAL